MVDYFWIKIYKIFQTFHPYMYFCLNRYSLKELQILKRNEEKNHWMERDCSDLIIKY